jgi:hypothetical protein
MTDRREDTGRFTLPKKPLSDEPGFVDGIPVEELVRMTREFTARITNEDRQRLTVELNEAGRNIQTGVPYLLQQFFRGKVDLDVELSKRFPGSPLVTPSAFFPPPGKRARYGNAQFLGQDGAAGVQFEMINNELEVSFLLGGMISVRFMITALPDTHKIKFLDLMRRPSGIALLWTRERWERDFLIFVVRDRYARLFAFSPGRFDAACRLTPDGTDQLMEWLTGFWGSESAPTEPRPDEGSAPSVSW